MARETDTLRAGEVLGEGLHAREMERHGVGLSEITFPIWWSPKPSFRTMVAAGSSSFDSLIVSKLYQILFSLIPRYSILSLGISRRGKYPTPFLKTGLRISVTEMPSLYYRRLQ